MALIKIETERGWELWTDVPDEPFVAIFTKEQDADRFMASQSIPDPDFTRIALKIAKAYRVLNLSNDLINPEGELVLNIARIIEQNWEGCD